MNIALRGIALTRTGQSPVYRNYISALKKCLIRRKSFLLNYNTHSCKRTMSMTVRNAAALLLLLLANMNVRADVTCICTTDSCTSKGMNTCTAKQTCYAQYERSLLSSRSQENESAENYDMEDEEQPDPEYTQYQPEEEYDYDDEGDEAFVTRGCIERPEVVRCDNKGPTGKITFPYVYCCHNDFCNNLQVLNEEQEDTSEQETDELPAHTARGVSFSTRKPTTSWPSLATQQEKKATKKPDLTASQRPQSEEVFGIHPIYVGLLISTITVLLLILIFAVVVFKRYNDSRYEPARKVLLFE